MDSDSDHESKSSLYYYQFKAYFESYYFNLNSFYSFGKNRSTFAADLQCLGFIFVASAINPEK